MIVKQQTKLFEKWFKKLDGILQDKIAKYIDRVLSGNFTNCKPVGDGVNEIKINYQKGYRVYYTVINKQTVLLLLCGGDKKSQSKDIQLAKDIKKFLEGAK